MGFEQLARLEREAGCVPANDNQLDSYFDKPDTDADDSPTGLGIRRDREAGQKRREAEKTAMQLAKAAIASRTAHCDKQWDGAANDNEDFPLLAALRREHDNDSIDVVLKYRQLVALVECEPLQGQRVGGELSSESRSTNLARQTEELFAGIQDKPEAERWKGNSLPGGEIRYKETKKRKGGTFHIPARHAVAANDETRVRTAPLAMPFNDDLLIRQIDAKPVLDHVRQSLGPLRDILDDAVLGARSYTDIGRRKGAKAKPDETGRVLVKWAILIAEDALDNAARIIRREEKKSKRRSASRRIEIALERARYLGRVA